MALRGGGIGFQWNSNNNEIFTVSIFGNSLFSFAGIWNENSRNRGTESIERIPKYVKTLLLERFSDPSLS